MSYKSVVTKNDLNVEIWYPRNHDKGYVYLHLVDVRASEGIRLIYDFDRDGWAIEQEEMYEFGGTILSKEPNSWKEVAFIKSWNLTTEEKE